MDTGGRPGCGGHRGDDAGCARADICHVAAAQLSSDVGALDDQVTQTGLTIGFHDGRDVAPFRHQSSLVAERASTASRMVSWAALVLPVCFL